MAKIIAIENVTLDGVMPAPAAPDEETRAGASRTEAGRSRTPTRSACPRPARAGLRGAMLLGRATYERFHEVWAGRDDNPFSPVLDARRKYVASTTLTDPLPWQHSTLLAGDTVAAIGELEEHAPEENLVLLGSGVLLRALLAADLVDEFQLSIHPLVLGSGTRLFAEGVPTARWSWRIR